MYLHIVRITITNYKFVPTTVVEVPTTKLIHGTPHGDYQRYKYIHAN